MCMDGHDVFRVHPDCALPRRLEHAVGLRGRLTGRARDAQAFFDEFGRKGTAAECTEAARLEHGAGGVAEACRGTLTHPL